MRNDVLCQAAAAQLVIVDIQTRLAATMWPDERLKLIANSAILLQAARLLDVPVLATEQYAKGLGATEEEVACYFPQGLAVIDKSCFSCAGVPLFHSALNQADRRQVILAGMETHVCVLQTALDLHGDGYEVFVVEDAACSRSSANHTNAIKRLRHAGVVVTSTESVVFEWLHDARHEQFKAVSALLK